MSRRRMLTVFLVCELALAAIDVALLIVDHHSMRAALV